MVQKVFTETVCDPCLREAGVEREASFVGVVTLGGGQAPQELALCTDHEQELVEPLRAALAAYGQRPTTVAERLLSSGRCPVCQREYRSRRRLIAHAEKEHPVMAAAVGAA